MLGATLEKYGVEQGAPEDRPIRRRLDMRSQDLVRVVALLGATLLGSAGCVAHAQGAASAEADAPVVFTSEPTLVEVDSGVWVVRDYDQPVYFVNDDYWVIRDGVWYRSHTYDGGWARVEVNVVPVLIVHRDHRLYVRYHGAATAQTRVAPRRHGEERRGPPEHVAEAKAPPAAEPAHVEEHHDDHVDHADDHHDKGRGKKHEEKKEEKKEDKRHKHH
jgi:hypothetical protein